MKRVLIFSLAYSPHVGGAEIALEELTRRMSDIEFEVVTLRFRESDARDERVGNVLVHRLGSGSSYIQKILFIPRAARFAARAHAERPFDAFWAMMSYMALPIALLRLAHVRVPYLLTLQDGDPYEHVFRRPQILPLMPLLWYGFQNASKISVLSTYLAAWPRQMGYNGAVVIVPNGVAVDTFAGAMPCDIGKKQGEFWLVTSSRLVHKNALDDVMRALVFLPLYVHFLVLGVGVEERRLRALVHELGVEERVHFKGHVLHAALPAYLHAADAFVRPSRSEGFGSAFVEAMAAGLPVIATQEGGISDFLFDARKNPEHPPTGFAVERDNPEQVADAVKEIMTNPDKVQKIRKNAYTLVREHYDWAQVAEQTRAIFGTMGV